MESQLVINRGKADKKKRILLIKYDKNNLDLIINDGFFGYFYGDNELLEFNEYSLILLAVSTA